MNYAWAGLLVSLSLFSLRGAWANPCLTALGGRILNPAWQDPSAEALSQGAWLPIGSAVSQGTGGHSRLRFSVAQTPLDVTLETEPFEVLQAGDQAYIRDRRTGEILARASKGGRRDGKLILKYLSASSDEPVHALNGASALDAFFCQIGRHAHTLLDGRRVPLPSGILVLQAEVPTMKSGFKVDPRVGPALQKMVDAGIETVVLGLPVIRYRDSQPYPGLAPYIVTAHPGFGIEIRPYGYTSSSYDSAFIETLLSQPSALVFWSSERDHLHPFGPGFSGTVRIGQDPRLRELGGRPFSWDSLK